MSFFGFDASLPRDRSHNANGPGFSAAPDPFAGLSQRNEDDDDDVLDFEETYDGLGNDLDETDDAFNVDTFGSSTVGRDFDFAGQTATIRSTLQDQQKVFAETQPAPRSNISKTSAKPARTGYERYAEPGFIPQLEANASIWGTQPKKASKSPVLQLQQPSHPSLATVTKKMMSLDEVEAAMRSQSKKPSTPNPPQTLSQLIEMPHEPLAPQQQYVQAPHILQRPQPKPPGGAPQVLPSFQNRPVPTQMPMPAQGVQILQRQPDPPPRGQAGSGSSPQQPRRVLQSQDRDLPLPYPDRTLLQSIEMPQMPEMTTQVPNRGLSLSGRVVTHPEQILHLSEEERTAFLLEDAKRAKRNHKIYLMSRDNGLMTPQDKNFITRIQLQQLVTATGGLEEQGPEAALAEDFYYQVYSQIRGGHRQNPNQPLNLFAQTYLHQTGGRGNRRYPRGGDSHMRRMEQQVQRAVEAAKLKPKNRQLVIEGSLGKISFSNAKTPKPLLNLKRQESSDSRPHSAGRARAPDTVAGRKAVLKDIENLYNTLMKMEDHERRMPAPTTEESSGDEIQEQMDWRQRIQELNSNLWAELKVLEPIDPSSSIPHPFIAILSHPKGKKLIPRVFRQVDDQQRLTILTMIIVHLDLLDVIQYGYPTPREPLLSLGIRNEVELFSQAVMPSLFNYANEAPLNIIIGFVGLITDRVNVPAVVHTKVGLGLLVMFITRAELIKQAGHADDTDWDQWLEVYNRLFDTIEPQLPSLFTIPLNSAEDLYVWQFLAAVGVGANPEQQQRLVIGVKERVMDTVMLAKTLPEDLARPRLDNVNLFMKAIGLDVELLG